jgi:molybdopterin-guanine dinucleotide biosynthesis protein A
MMNYYILVGGESTRMGENKALVLIEGETVIERILNRIPAQARHEIIVSNRQEEFSNLNHTVIGDIRPGYGPISGIHSGLHHSPYFYNFFLACDMPLLNPDLLSLLAERIGDSDMVAFKNDHCFEPLCAVYSKNCLPAIEKKIDCGSYSLQDLPELLKSDIITLIDSVGLMNMNDRADYHRIIEYLKKNRTKIPT